MRQSDYDGRRDELPTLMHGQAHNFVQRILLLAVLFGAELIALSVCLDDDSLVRPTVLIGMMHDRGAWAVRCLVAFAVIFITFVYLRNKDVLGQMTGQAVQSPMKWGLLVAHCLALATFVALSSLLYKAVSSLVSVRAFSNCSCRISFFPVVPLGSVTETRQSFRCSLPSIGSR